MDDSDALEERDFERKEEIQDEFHKPDLISDADAEIIYKKLAGQVPL
jgi:hypothetical protein